MSYFFCKTLPQVEGCEYACCWHILAMSFHLLQLPKAIATAIDASLGGFFSGKGFPGGKESRLLSYCLFLLCGVFREEKGPASPCCCNRLSEQWVLR